ncbi:hypothetical protein C1646_674628 [Rhizophagus diaphanus]|nr:hypothetical protein C1646_674628 [Rhizophagus diaphanus] [Rhizophagus sp. MUCL 43196]
MTCGEDPGGISPPSEENWLRRIKKRNKKRKRLPHLPPGIPGIRIYYRTTYNINLFDYKISHHDQSIINAPEFFFRRTPPPDNDSHITVSSDNSSHKSANDHVEASNSTTLLVTNNTHKSLIEDIDMTLYSPTPAHNF